MFSVRLMLTALGGDKAEKERSVKSDRSEENQDNWLAHVAFEKKTFLLDI